MKMLFNAEKFDQMLKSADRMNQSRKENRESACREIVVDHRPRD